MNTDPTNDPSENTAPNQEPPWRTLAISILPAGLPDHLVPKWGINAAGGNDERKGRSRESEQALAIGPSGPAILPLSQAELAARASALNFNPYHDKLGRFTTSDEATDTHEGKERLPDGGVYQSYVQADGQDQSHQHGQRPAQRQSGKGTEQKYPSQEPIGKISDYSKYGSPNNATGVAAAIRTIIATFIRKEAPGLNVIKAQLETAASEVSKTGYVRINWVSGGISANATDCAAIVQKVLSTNGVKSTNNLGYDPSGKPVLNVPAMQGLADTLIAKGTPAMVN